MSNQSLSDVEVKKGWVNKLNKGIYRKRWFVLRGDGTLSWFACEKETTKRGTIFLMNGIRLVKEYDGNENIIVIKTVKEGDNCWYLRIKCPDKRLSWINEIERIANDDGDGIIEIGTEQHKTEMSYKFLEPKLAFQVNLPEKVLQTSVAKDINLNTQVAKSLRLAGAALDFVLPGAGRIVNVIGSIEILIVDGPSAFKFFRNQDLKEDGVNGKIIEHILLDKLVSLQAEIGTLETRYKQLRNPNSSPDMKIAEIITSVNTCEKYLRIFQHPDSVLYKNPMVTSPYLVQFALLFMNISTIARALLPHYQETIIEYMIDLTTCLLQYKKEVLKVRMNAIRGNFEDMIKSPWDKVIDDMYPCNTGGFITREAYSNSPLTKHLDSGKKFLGHYKANVMKVYSSYFDPVIEQANEQFFNLCSDEFGESEIGIIPNTNQFNISHEHDQHQQLQAPAYGWTFNLTN